jgi:hypothetical protein
MIDVRYVAVEGPRGEEEAWGVVVNGHLVATDSDNDALTCGEVADNLAHAFGTESEYVKVRVQNDDWTWEDDVLPTVGVAPQEPPVVLHVQRHIEDLLARPQELGRSVQACLEKGVAREKLARRAAEIACASLLDLNPGYFETLANALEAAVEELGENDRNGSR